jgi:ammonium transporter, Amt family
LRALGAVALAAFAAASIAGSVARADDAKPPTPEEMAARIADLEAYVTNGIPKNLVSSGPGHNAWMMTSAALVLFMTLPGLALFYGGLVRRKNILSVMAQCFGCAGVVTLLWWIAGYSFAFAPGTPFLGSLKFAFLNGVGPAPNGDYAAWVSQNVFSMYQMMFATSPPR